MQRSTISSIPNYGLGIATGSASEAGEYLWSNLFAFAPFVLNFNGVSFNNRTIIFGRGRLLPNGNSVASGTKGRSMWGPAFEYTATSSGIVLSLGDKRTVMNGIGEGLTMICGYRNTTPGDTTAIRFLHTDGLGITDARAFCAQWNPVSTNLELYFGGGKGTAVFDPTVEFTRDRVLAMSCRVGSANPYSFFLDGIALPIASATTPAMRTISTVINLRMGYGPNVPATALGTVGFMYYWPHALSDDHIATISRDPGILFRPRRPVVGRSIVGSISMAAVGTGVAAMNVGTLASMTLAASGSAAPALSLKGYGKVLSGLAGLGTAAMNIGARSAITLPATGAGAVTANVGALSNATLPTAGIGVTAMSVTGIVNIVMAATGTSVASLSLTSINRRASSFFLL